MGRGGVAEEGIHDGKVLIPTVDIAQGKAGLEMLLVKR
jgi:hypothetical protein